MIPKQLRRRSQRDATDLSDGEKLQITWVYPRYLRDTPLEDQLTFFAAAFVLTSRVSLNSTDPRPALDRQCFFDFVSVNCPVDWTDPAQIKKTKMFLKSKTAAFNTSILIRIRNEVVKYIGSPSSPAYVCRNFNKTFHYFPEIADRQARKSLDNPETLFLNHMKRTNIQFRIWSPVLKVIRKDVCLKWESPFLQGLTNHVLYIAPTMIAHVCERFDRLPDNRSKLGSFNDAVKDTWASSDCSYFTRKFHDWQSQKMFISKSNLFTANENPDDDDSINGYIHPDDERLQMPDVDTGDGKEHPDVPVIPGATLIRRPTALHGKRKRPPAP